MSWIYIAVAGVMEVGFALGLKYAQGFTRLWPSVWTAVAAAMSLFFLSLGLRSIPVGIGYAVWTGIGAAGTVLIGMALLDEPRDAPRLLCIAFILAGVIGLGLMTPEPAEPPR